MPPPQDLPQTPEMQNMLAMQRQQIDQQKVLQRQLLAAQKLNASKSILQRLKPEAAGRLIRNMIEQRKSSRSESRPSSPEESISGSSSSTLVPKHLAPSDDSSSTTTGTAKFEYIVPEDATTLKRKRTDDAGELDEVTERVKRVKLQRKSLWESFDDSQFKMNSGLLYDPKLWEWYW